MDAELLVEKLLAYAERNLYLQPVDTIYMRNTLLAELKLQAPCEGEADVSDVAAMDVPDELNAEIAAYAVEHGLTDEANAERYCARIFGMLTPPSFQDQRGVCRPSRAVSAGGVRLSVQYLRQKRVYTEDGDLAQPQMELRRRRQRAGDHGQSFQTGKEQ